MLCSKERKSNRGVKVRKVEIERERRVSDGKEQYKGAPLQGRHREKRWH